MIEAVVIFLLGMLVWVITEGAIPLPGMRTDVRPRLRSKPIHVRFGLRTMLIVVTIVAVLLGLAAAYLRLW